MRRRDLVFGAMGVGALGTAEALRPRRRIKLLQGTTIEASMPSRFGAWSSEKSSDYIGSELSGSLTRELYSEIVPRTYFHDETGDGVAILAAYGDTQSDVLQVHRPEFCYPAVGFNLRENRALTLPLGNGVVLPARKVVAYRDGRTENIIYWTRMGEDLPQSAREQRATRIRQSIEGYVPDGILMRMSAFGDSEPAYALLGQFIPAFLRAVPARSRKAFVGTGLGRRIA